MDPWDWDLDDVVAFFRSDDRALESDLILPDADSKRIKPNFQEVETAFTKHSVDGAALLEFADLKALKDDLGITSFSLRGALMRSIQFLRSHSRMYQFQTPAKLAHLQYLPTQTPPRSASPLHSEHTSDGQGPMRNNPRLRSNERLILSGDGRFKRRKLLTAQPQSGVLPEKPLPLTESLPSSHFLAPEKLTIESFLPNSSHNMNKSDDDNTDNFAFIMSQKDRHAAIGSRKVLYKRLRSFLCATAQPISDSEYVVPFNWSLKDPHSAVLFAGGESSVTHKKVDATTFQTASPETKPSERTEWDFLDKWVVKDRKDADAGVEPDVLPVYLESGDENDYNESLLDEVEEEEQLRESQAKPRISQDAVRNIIEKELLKMKTSWEERKLPRLEQKAYQLWSQAYSHGRKRAAIIEQTTNKLSKLESRLEKFRKAILDEVWYKESDISFQTQVLEVTFTEKLETNWRIQVWRGPQPLRTAVLPLSQNPRPAKNIDAESEEISSDSDKGEDSDGFVARTRHIATTLRQHTFIDKDAPLVSIEDSGSLNDMEFDEEALEATYQESEEFTTDSQSPLYPEAIAEANLHGMNDTVDQLSCSSSCTPPDKFTLRDVESWSIKELMEQGDATRLIYKVIEHCLPLSVGQDILEFVVDNILPTIQTEVNNGIDELFKDEHQRPEGECRYFPAAFALARLWVCWSQCSVYHLQKPFPAPSEEDLKAASEKCQPENLLDFIFVIRGYKRNVVDVEVHEEPESLSDSEELPLDAIPQSESRKRKRNSPVDTVDAKQKNAAKRQALAEQVEQSTRSMLEEIGASQTEIGEIINLDKTEEQPFIRIHSHISSCIKKHQIEGIRFMWRQLTNQESEGCLLAHTMGLGKSMQVIAIMVAIAEACHSPTPAIQQLLPKTLRVNNLCMLVLCPPSVLDNWLDEFRKWVPHPSQTIGTVTSISSQLPPEVRIHELKKWSRSGGVLLLGYTLFRQLMDEKRGYELSPREILIRGPALVIADEAQNFKNYKAKLGSIIGAFHTQSRIAMTGSPLSNHCDEYYAMINWIQPGYLGSPESFGKKYRAPIERGFYADSSIADRRKALTRLQALNTRIAPKVHRKDVHALEGTLPPKTEFVMILSLSSTQKRIYNQYIEAYTLADREKNANFLALTPGLCRLLAHPVVFLNTLKKIQGPGRIETSNNSYTTSQQVTSLHTGIRELNQVPSSTSLEVDRGHNARSRFIRDTEAEIKGKEHEPALSVKMQILLRILKGSKALGEKVLVFCTYIGILDYLQVLIPSYGIKVQRFDGKTKMVDRQALTKDFNTNDTDVFLISTKAGGVGLNIHGANRVVILTFGYNPTDEDQAIGRAYRLGQTKPVYVYHMVTGGTIEEITFQKVLFKRQLAFRVVDKKKPSSAAERGKAEAILAPVKEIPRESLTHLRGSDSIMDGIIDNCQELLDLHTTAVLNTEIEEPLNEEEEREVQALAAESEWIYKGNSNSTVTAPGAIRTGTSGTGTVGTGAVGIAPRGDTIPSTGAIPTVPNVTAHAAGSSMNGFHGNHNTLPAPWLSNAPYALFTQPRNDSATQGARSYHWMHDQPPRDL